MQIRQTHAQLNQTIIKELKSVCRKMEKNFSGLFTIGLFVALLASGQAHLNIFLNLHEVLRLIGK